MILYLLYGTIFGIICGCGLRIGVGGGVLFVTFSTSEGVLQSPWKDHTPYCDLIEIYIRALFFVNNSTNITESILKTQKNVKVVEYVNELCL